ncbi:MAG TPA: DUF5926 family protein [Mycobacteriales bacterium]|nr:DUF5926 family protein [Mycobacteriales bacterium]
MDPKAPCPCGSGRRYKSCHGAGDVVVARPFAGLASECDWVALRELVPSATAPLALKDSDREVTLATLLPLALPAIVRADGRILLGLQVHARSGDVSRDVAHVLEQALEAEPGTMVSTTGLPGPGPRLQDLLDGDAALEPAVHRDFAFWLEGSTSEDPEVAASLERANAAVVPTVRLEQELGAAYWCRIGDKAHLRWVVPYEEDALLDALARLGAAGELTLGDGTRYAGSFRAHGLLVPVWDLPTEPLAGQWEEPASAFAGRLAEALGSDAPLSSAERRSRDGIRGRQLTLR